MLDIRNFTSADIPDALALCAQVNWNHIAADWQRLIDLLPEGCIGGFDGRRMRASCTITRFGKLGWIGTFLVDQALRGTGEGTALFDALLNKAKELGMETLGLDSSDAGRPIYLKKGFVMTGQGIELWTGAPARVTETEALPLQNSQWDALLAFDARAMRIDRAEQLRHLSVEPGASVRVLVEQGAVSAFGFSRPGKMTGTIGPVVALDLHRAQTVIRALMCDRRQIDGEKPVGMAVHDHAELKHWLAEEGFQQRRRNIRMFRPAVVDVCAGPQVFAATALGMG